MYKYFVSFNYYSKKGNGFGNTIMECNNRMSDLEDIEEMARFISDAEKWVESQKPEIKNVIIISIQEL